MAGGGPPAPGAGEPLAAYDGLRPAELAARLGVPGVALYARVGSTQDAAHVWGAAGAPHGALVLADEQTGGRGRAGRAWASPPGSGAWLTMVVRPRDAGALEVLALRAGLLLAEALESLAPAPVRVKWPNDLLVGGRKLAGVLVEARWRDGRAEWAAVGVGLNVRPPATFSGSAALRPGVARVDALAAVVGALRQAGDAIGLLGAAELERLAGRDEVRGRRTLDPVAGVVEGVAPAGALLVRAPDGRLVEVRQTTVTYAE